MQIVQYHPRALVGDGGISNSVRRLSKAMVSGGAEVRIAYEPNESPGNAAEAGDAVWWPTRHVGWRGFRVPLTFDAVLAGSDVLVLNSAWTAHNVRAAAVARSSGVPYVIADRGAYDPLILQRRRVAKRVWWRLLEERAVLGARALHVFFDSQEKAVRNLGFTGEILVAPNGVNVPAGVNWDGGSGGYLLYVGRFDPEHKGLDLLVRAVKTLPEMDRPEIRMHGPDWRGGKPSLESLVSELDLEDRVLIGPPVYGSEKWDLMKSAAGFVYPSRWEAFGNSTAEAAALGLPVLVTGYPLGRYLADHSAAFLVETSVTGIADGMVQLRSAEASSVGAKASKLVREAFTWDAVAQVWLTQLAGFIK
jgi:glycosyltransferase involved in cell wall biosynthesis